jgi:uncharacterized protein
MSQVELVKRWFGIEENEKCKVKNGEWGMPEVIRPGRVVLISGASGSGKSSLLRAMRAQCAYRWIDLQKIRLRDVPVVDCFGNERVEKILERLSRVGLGEVWTYLRRPSQLSEGQRWRLRLAIALHRAEKFSGVPQGRAPVVICADEFAALLDRITAKIISRCVRKSVDASSNLCAVLATSHDDLRDALRPDIEVQCDFGAGDVVAAGTAAGIVAECAGGEDTAALPMDLTSLSMPTISSSATKTPARM